MPLVNRLKNPRAVIDAGPAAPLWKGPEEDGVTFSLLSRFLVCRERFRALVVDGMAVRDSFNHRIEFGNMWHVCEEAHAANRGWVSDLLSYCVELTKRYPSDRDLIAHWHAMVKVQFQVYTDFWARHTDVKGRKPLLQEQVFNVPFRLPSGRVVRLRGKWDSVDLIDGKVYLQENKTKSSIDVTKLSRQLTFDLQAMIYLTALVSSDRWGDGASVKGSVAGVRYNVIRRSAHKSTESMLKKLHEDIADRRGQEWFARVRVEVQPADIEQFRVQCLNPILEQLCDWWLWIDLCRRNGESPYGGRVHWRHPFGVYNVLDEGGASDLDEYVSSGSRVSLERVASLFPELDRE